MSVEEKKYEGECFCGSVRVEVTGDPVGTGYCHCKNCRKWKTAPIQAFTLWHADQVKVTQGAELLGEYTGNGKTFRQWCTKCGGQVMQRHPDWDMINVFAPTLPTYPFEVQLHVNYASTVQPIKDGLPKLRDFPEELGGTGESVPE